MGRKLRVLFLCAGDSWRSQMAEGFARALKGEEIKAYSAGVEAHALNPRAVRVMAEAGVDLADRQPRALEELANIRFDYVVTVCNSAREHCPVFTGRARIVPVSFEDPVKPTSDDASEEEALESYRRVRDQIRAFVEGLPGNLGA